MNKTTELRTRVSRMAAIVGVIVVGVAASGARAQDKDAQLLLQTLSEEKTEINTLSAQQAAFVRMGGRENQRIAGLLGRMIRDHKAASPTLIKLTQQNGGNPSEAKILKPPVLGDKMKMLHADMVDHMKAEQTSQMRYAATNDPAIKKAMKTRAGIARKHMEWMKPYHSAKNCPQCAQMMKGNSGMKGGMQHGAHSGGTMHGTKTAAMCPHCNVKMVNGKCPVCGMTAEQMKKS